MNEIKQAFDLPASWIKLIKRMNGADQSQLSFWQ